MLIIIVLSTKAKYKGGDQPEPHINKDEPLIH